MKVSIIEPGGLNLELALRFVRDGYDTAYYSEFHEAFPSGQRESIGTGFPGLRKCNSLAHALDHGDVIVCPDTHSRCFADLADKYKKPVWAARGGELLEQDRLGFKQQLKRMGLPVGQYFAGTGLNDLEGILKTKKDLFVKFPGSFRGIGETRHHYDWEKTKREWWGHVLVDFGANMDEVDWVAEVPIKHVVEVAADELVVDGQYNENCLIGIEAKDSSYVGYMGKVPKILQATNEKLSMGFRSWKSKTFFSAESMIGEDGKVYVTDPCVRTGHPVSALQIEIYENITEFVVEAATRSRCIPIKKKANFGVALEVKSESLDDGWLEVQFPEKIRNSIKLVCARRIKDAFYVIPKAFTACTVIGLGGSLADAVGAVKENVHYFSCNGMFYDLTSLDKLVEEAVPKARKYGITF